MATYVNNLRLTELATGEGSGTWGTTTNTNLELIGEALGYGSEAIANASTHTITVADGTADSARSFYLKLTGGGQACTVTLAPNTLSKVWMVENTTNSTLTFSQGSGANVAVPAGQVKMIATDGAGSGAVVYDLLVDTDLTGTTTVVNLTSSGTIDAATVEFNSLSGTGSVAITDILDQDNMSSDSATALATQQSIKAYVDSSVASFDTLAEVLAQGNTTGGTDIAVSASDDITFTDSSKAIFGGGSDMQLYHNGSHSFISEQGTGDLYIGGSNNIALMNAAFSENKILATTDGAVKLYYNGVEKLASTNTGISVTGEVAATGLEVEAATPVIEIDSTTSANLATLQFTTTGTVDSKITHQASSGDMTIESGRNSTWGGKIYLKTDTFTNALFTRTTSTFNENGADIDFRVESNNHTHALFVQGSNGNVGINEPAPDAQLHILGTNATNGATIKLQEANNNTSDNLGTILFGNNSDDSLARVQGYTHTNNTTSALYFGSTNTATNVRNLDLLHNIAIFNENGDDIDFRIESDNNANMLFVNAGIDQVAIGSGSISAPSGYQFLSYGAGSGARSAFVHGAGDGGIVVSGAAGGSAASVIFGNNWGTNGATFNEEWRLYMNGADDTLQFNHSENATKTLVLTPTSMVGINEPSPDYHLHVNSGATNVVAKFESTDGTSVIQFVDNNGNSEFGTSGSTARISPNGSYAVLEASQSAVVINNASQDTDFRVESDSNTHMLFVDAGSNEVGIGTNDPRSPLHVQTTHTETDVTSANTNSTLSVGNSGSGNGVYNAIKFPGNQQDMYIMSFNNSSNTGRRLGFFVGSVAGDAVDDEKLSILGNGRVGINDTTPSYPLDVNGTASIRSELRLGSSSSDPGILAINDNSGTAYTMSIKGTSTREFTIEGSSSGGEYNLYLNNASVADGFNLHVYGSGIFNQNGDDYDFRVESSGNSHMLFVDAGNDVVNIGHATNTVGTSSGTLMVNFIGNVANGIKIRDTRGEAGTNNMMVFVRGDSEVGSITSTTSATAYNTSSDQRLKENIADADDSGNLIDAIQVRKFDWKADGSHQDYGMVAQELQTVAPEAVSAPENPDDMMGVDYSKLVPMLVKEIQSLRARVAELETN